MTSQATLTQPTQRRSFLRIAIALLILSSAILYRFGAELFDALQGKSQAVPLAVEQKSKSAVEEYELRIQKNPNNATNYAGLGLSLLQQVRETGDTTFYARSGKALDKALALDAKNVDAMLGQGMLAAAMHNFPKALEWSEKAWANNQFKSEILGIKVDALVELGRYDEAVATLQQMVDLRPDLSSYSRISYVRELHGDVKGAIEAMRMAVESTPVGTESWLWTLTHLGNLSFNQGDLDNAANIYQQVLSVRTNYPYALAGMARVEGAQQHLEQAIARLKPVSEKLPLPEFLTLLGELYDAAGNQKIAREQYDLVGVIQQLNAGAGMNVDLEMALFNANHGSEIGVAASTTVEQARAAYGVRPTIYGADALGWALYQAGDFVEAQKYSQESLRLTTQDAMLYFHAGMIENALGNANAAKQSLQMALQINPYFSLYDLSIAQKTLDTLN